MENWRMAGRAVVKHSTTPAAHHSAWFRMELRKTFQFEAAHLLPHLPKSHKCRRLHGHSFKVEVVIDGDCDPKLGWVMDYADMSKAFQPIWKRVDHLPERHSRSGEPYE